MTKIADNAYLEIIKATGEDPNREGLQKTPLRAAKAFAYLTQGYEQTLEEVVNDAVFSSDNRDMVMVRNIEFYSLCEHHMLPFVGVAHVAYLPEGKVLGLSKIARIVDMYARRLQIQESLTKQVASAIIQVTGARGVAVLMDAEHMCMSMRGVSKQHASTRTISFLGEFESDTELRREFLGETPRHIP